VIPRANITDLNDFPTYHSIVDDNGTTSIPRPLSTHGDIFCNGNYVFTSQNPRNIEWSNSSRIASGRDRGEMELSTVNNFPIHVRQFSNSHFHTGNHRTLTLLDTNGNTTIPGDLTVNGTINSASLFNSIYPIGSLFSVSNNNLTIPPPPSIGTWEHYGYTGYGTSGSNQIISIVLWYSFSVMFTGSRLVDMTFNVSTPENTNFTIPLNNHGVSGLCHYPESVTINNMGMSVGERRHNFTTNWITRQPVDNTSYPTTSNFIFIDTNGGSTTKIRNYHVTVKCIVNNINTLLSQMNPNSTFGITYRRTG
jgi:hypothetical protein